MKTIAIIPARGGSERIPGKNMKPINGKPLFLWSFEQAIACQEIDLIVATTDSDEIKAAADSYMRQSLYTAHGFMRGEATTGDGPLEAVIKEVLQGYGEYDRAVILQPTSPVRGPNDIRDALRAFDAHKAHSLMSVESGTLVENGSIYVIDVKRFFKEGCHTRHVGKIVCHPMPAWQSVELDYPNQWEQAERALERMYGNSNRIAVENGAGKRDLGPPDEAHCGADSSGIACP